MLVNMKLDCQLVKAITFQGCRLLVLLILSGMAKTKWAILLLRFFVNSPQLKNVNIANFILAIPLRIN